MRPVTATQLTTGRFKRLFLLFKDERIIDKVIGRHILWGRH